MSKPNFAGIGSTFCALACVFVYTISERPDRIAFLFAAVTFVVNGAAARIIAHIKEAAK